MVQVTKPLDDNNSQRSSGYVNYIYPWRNQNEHDRRRGGEKSLTSICFIAFMLLCTSCTLCGISLWAIIYRLPYSYVANSSIYLDSNMFYIIAGVLTLPCSYIAWTSSVEKSNDKSIPMLVILLGISIMMLLTGTGMSAVLRTHILFGKTPEGNAYLVKNNYHILTNMSMANTMMSYDTNYNIRYSWNKVQTRLSCCGINGPKDWAVYSKHSGKPPLSCFHCVGNTSVAFTTGCILPMVNDIAIQTCLLMGFGIGVFIIELIILIYVMGLGAIKNPLSRMI